MPDNKKDLQNANNILPENASPVCYAASSELRPEYKEESNHVVNLRPDSNIKRKVHKPGKKKKLRR